MLYTLHSYISRELAKVFAIAALSLTLVLSLGGLLKPLRDQGVSAVQLFQLLIYIFPAMLTFSLPVAALLSTTLVYGRLSADNELTACRASGISMWSLVAPGVALGVVVMVSNLLLSNWFIPHCAQRADKVVKADLEEIIFNKLRTDRELRYSKLVITADRAERAPDGRIVLTAPSITELVKNAPPERMVWCRKATLQLDSVNNQVLVVPEGAVGVPWSEAGVPFRIEQAAIGIALPAVTKDDVSFRTYAELIELRRNPDSFYRVKSLLDQCRRIAMQKLLYDELYAALRSRPGYSPSYRMKYEYTDPKQLVAGQACPNPKVELRDCRIEADQVRWVNAEKPDKGVALGLPDETDYRVVFTLLGAPPAPGAAAPARVRYIARGARLEIESPVDSAGPMVGIEFPGDYTRQDLEAGTPPAHNKNLKMTERLLPDPALVERVSAMKRADLESLPLPKELRARVRREVARLGSDIVAELHSRGAFAVAGLVLVMLGAALGIIFRSGHVLVAFGVAAVPALFAILMVVMGNKVASSSKSSLQQMGVLFIWSGNVLIIGLNAFVYTKLLKH